MAVAVAVTARSVLVLQHSIHFAGRPDPHAAHRFLLYQPYVTSFSELGSFAGGLRGRRQRLRGCWQQMLRREGLQVYELRTPTTTTEHATQRNDRQDEPHEPRVPGDNERHREQAEGRPQKAGHATFRVAVERQLDPPRAVLRFPDAMLPHFEQRAQRVALILPVLDDQDVPPLPGHADYDLGSRERTYCAGAPPPEQAAWEPNAKHVGECRVRYTRCQSRAIFPTRRHRRPNLRDAALAGRVRGESVPRQRPPLRGGEERRDCLVLVMPLFSPPSREPPLRRASSQDAGDPG